MSYSKNRITSGKRTKEDKDSKQYRNAQKGSFKGDFNYNIPAGVNLIDTEATVLLTVRDGDADIVLGNSQIYLDDILAIDRLAEINGTRVDLTSSKIFDTEGTILKTLNLQDDTVLGNIIVQTTAGTILANETAKIEGLTIVVSTGDDVTIEDTDFNLLATVSPGGNQILQDIVVESNSIEQARYLAIISERTINLGIIELEQASGSIQNITKTVGTQRISLNGVRIEDTAGANLGLFDDGAVVVLQNVIVENEDGVEIGFKRGEIIESIIQAPNGILEDTGANVIGQVLSDGLLTLGDVVLESNSIEQGRFLAQITERQIDIGIIIIEESSGATGTSETYTKTIGDDTIIIDPALRVYYEVSDDVAEFLIDSNIEGTYTDDSNSFSVGTLTYEIDTGGGFSPDTLPFTLNSGDTLRITRSSTASAGYAELR